MTTIKLVNLNTQKEIVVLSSEITILGRGATCECVDKRVSRRHASLKFLPEQKTLLLEALHSNPCYWMKNGVPPIQVIKSNHSIGLEDGDFIALIPNENWFKVLINIAENAIDEEPSSPTLLAETDTDPIISDHGSRKFSNTPVSDRELFEERGKLNDTLLTPENPFCSRSFQKPSRPETPPTPDFIEPLSPNSPLSHQRNSAKSTIPNNPSFLPSPINDSKTSNADLESQPLVLLSPNDFDSNTERDNASVTQGLPLGAPLLSPRSHCGGSDKVATPVSSVSSARKPKIRRLPDWMLLDDDSPPKKSAFSECTNVSTAGTPPSTSNVARVKLEPQPIEEEESDRINSIPSSSSTLTLPSTPPLRVAVKTEPGLHSTNPVKPERARRALCQYEHACYRKNPIHKNDFSHPGDADWVAPNDRPTCPYGSRCYRQSQAHRVNVRHPDAPVSIGTPSSTASQVTDQSNSDSSSDYGDETDNPDDPFQTDDDGDESYVPSSSPTNIEE